MYNHTPAVAPDIPLPQTVAHGLEATLSEEIVSPALSSLCLLLTVSTYTILVCVAI